jgi:hypothetical protein
LAHSIVTASPRYREAAQVYERLWRDTQAPKYLSNAGMARGAAEHDSAAISSADLEGDQFCRPSRRSVTPDPSHPFRR